MNNLTTMLPLVRYLKHSGRELDVKVAIARKLNEPLIIHIRDSEFSDVPAALAYLRRIAETEIVGQSFDDEAVAS